MSQESTLFQFIKHGLEPGILINSDLEIQAVNRPFMQLSERSADQLIGESCFNIIGPVKSAQKQIRSDIPISQVFRKEGPVRLKSYLILPTGKKAIEINGFCPTVEEQERLAVLQFRSLTETGMDAGDYVFEDTPEQEGVFSEPEVFMSNVIGNLPGFVYKCRYDDHWTMLYLSKGFEEISGYKVKDVIQNRSISYNEIIHPKDRDRVRKWVDNKLDGKGRYSFSYRIMSREGEEKWVMEQGNGVFADSGELKYLIGYIFDITSFKETQMALAERIKMFRTFSQNLKSAVYTINNSNRFTYVNDACNTITGYTSEELQKMRFFDLVHPEYQALVKKMGTERLQGKNPIGFYEFKIIRKDGEHRWLEVSNSMVEVKGENHILGTAIDVTERKEAELVQQILLRISNAANVTRKLHNLFSVIRTELARLLDTKNFFIALYEKKTNQLSLPFHIDVKDSFNHFPKGKSLTGYLIDQKQSLLLTKKEIEGLASAGQIEIIGTPAKVWMGTPLKVNNEVTGAIVLQNYKDSNAFNHKDLKLLEFISEQVSVLIARKNTEMMIAESEQKFRTSFQSNVSMMAIIDHRGMIADVNRSFNTLLGYRPDQLKGKYIGDCELFGSKEERSGIVEEVANYEVLKNKEISIYTSFGNKRKALMSLDYLTISGQRSAFLTLYDITERIETMKKLKKAKERAEESDRLKTAFLANMSHEIRTPMNAIIGFSELLREPDIPEQSKNEFIDLICDNSKQLLNLIEDIIDIAKIEAGQIKVSTSPCDIHQIMRNAYASFQNIMKRMKKRDISFQLHIPEGPHYIKTDGSRLKQVFNNLLHNAFKFTQSGSIEMGYSVKSDNENEMLVFYVKDTGIGIEKDKQHLIFERFRQVEDVRDKAYGGTGLGLTISRKIAELLGGNMWLESEPGKGSTFFFSVKADDLPSENVVENDAVTLKEFDLKGKHVLIAEDNRSNYLMIETILKKTGAVIYWAKNGVEALEICNNHPEIDIVLMDVAMPVMNGMDATGKIRNLRKDLPVVILSAHSLPKYREESLNIGADEYLTKPVKASRLLSVINKYVLNNCLVK